MGVLLQNAYTGFCTDTKDVWRFVGWVVNIVKIVIPVILIVLAIIAFGKAVISDDDKEIKTAVSSLIKKFIIAVLIFFIPQIVLGLFGAIHAADETLNDSRVCINCVNHPNKC